MQIERVKSRVFLRSEGEHGLLKGRRLVNRGVIRFEGCEGLEGCSFSYIRLRSVEENVSETREMGMDVDGNDA